MRVLFVCNPLFGHLHPLVPLAQATRRAGHDVVLSTGADLVPLAEREGLATWSAGLTHQALGGNQQESWLAYFEQSARARLTDLMLRCETWRPDWIVSEETELAGPILAGAVGARSLIHGLGPMPPPRLALWFVAALERLAPSPTAAIEAVRLWRSSTYFELCPPSLRPNEERSWSSAAPLRPMAPMAGDDLALRRRLAALPRRRSVFVTLGTVYSHRVEVLATAIAALRARSLNVIVATGPAGDPRRLGIEDDANVVVETHVPLPIVLEHCDAVVSQGGSGVMFAGFARGLPQLLLPQGADQFRNAELAVASGAALTLMPDTATRSTIEGAVERLLEEPAFGAAARRIRDEIATLPDADECLATLVAM